MTAAHDGLVARLNSTGARGAHWLPRDRALDLISLVRHDVVLIPGHILAAQQFQQSQVPSLPGMKPRRDRDQLISRPRPRWGSRLLLRSLLLSIWRPKGVRAEGTSGDITTQPRLGGRKHVLMAWFYPERPRGGLVVGLTCQCPRAQSCSKFERVHNTVSSTGGPNRIEVWPG